MRAINLLPREALEPASQRRTAPIVAACIALVVAGAFVAGFYLSASSHVGSAQGELAAAQSELSGVPKPIGVPATIAALPQERQARVTVLGTALSQRIVWDRLLREVSLVLPSDVWLTTMSATTPFSQSATTATAGPGAPPTDFSLQGFTYSQDGVARLLSRLSVIPDLDRVTLQSSTQTTASARPVFQFAIVAGVRAPGVSS